MSGPQTVATATFGTLTRALVLVRATRVALADPGRWSQGAWARDKDGASVDGVMWEAARSPHAHSRALLAEFFHQAWMHGYVVQVDAPRLLLTGFHRAPASVWVASEALADACLAVFPSRTRQGQQLGALRRFIGAKNLDERVVLALGELNEHGTHSDVMKALDKAERALQTELDRRADERAH